MIKRNYTKKAPLLEIEQFDYDVDDSWETHINEKGMKLPTRYDISRYYKRDLSKPSRYDYKGNPKFERGKWEKKEEEDLPSISEDFDWQITYRFPSTLHPHVTPSGKTYGGKSVTNRRLYLILCEHFNGGRYFIDDYFDTVYPTTIKSEVDARLDLIKEDLLGYADMLFEGAVVTKSGALHKRRKANRGMISRMREYKSFARQWEASEGRDVARMIREDIIRCMETGQLQLLEGIRPNSEKTNQIRKSVGLSSVPVFYAMGSLIESIELFVNLGGNGKWRTRQGLMV